MTGITYFNGRVIRRFNDNIEALDVMYKLISTSIFQMPIFNLILKLKLHVTVK
jgi:hypothetical protein